MATNLITNGGFYNGSRDYWGYSDRVSFVTNAGCEGGVTPDGCAFMQNQGVGGAREIIQLVQNGIVGGHTYTLSYYAKRFNRYDTWAAIGYWDNTGTNWTFRDLPSMEYLLAHDQYRKITYTITLPSNIGPSLWVYIKGGADAVNGWSSLQIDNVVLEDNNAGSGGTDPEIGPHTANNTDLRGNPAAMEQNARCVYNYMRAKGWSRNAICGMLGNMDYESTINPGRYGNNGTNTNVFGIVQWNPGSKYTNWASQNGYTNNSMKGQLERILFEVQNPREQWGLRDPASTTFPAYTTSTKSAADLATIFRTNYENSGSGDSSRRSYATKWYNTFTY